MSHYSSILPNHKNFVLEKNLQEVVTTAGQNAQDQGPGLPLQFVTALLATFRRQHCTVFWTASLLRLLYHVLRQIATSCQIQATENRFVANRELITVRVPGRLCLRSDYACDNSCRVAAAKPLCNCW
jgi:hypothetical protein